jgi:hypothetical protein
METILQFTHALLIILLLTYPFIINKNILFDKLFILLFILGKLSWIVFKDECFISYLYKRVNNKDYILGDNSNELSDIINIVKNDNLKYLLYIVLLLFPVIYALEVFYVNSRIGLLPTNILIVVLFLYFVYLYYIHFMKKTISKNTANYVTLFKIIYLVFLLAVIYNYFLPKN